MQKVKPTQEPCDLFCTALLLTNNTRIMNRKIKKSDFRFQFAGYGHYKVTYKSPRTRKEWTKTLDDMSIIDATKNEDFPLQSKLEELKKRVKSQTKLL